MTAIETLDDAYATIADKADDGTCTRQERTMLLHAAADVRFRKNALELVAEERERRMFTFGPAGAVLCESA